MLSPTTKKRAAQLGVAATSLAILSTGVALACHPQGTITKGVQNVTTGSQLMAADTTTSAVVAHPGDTLVYKITVGNKAAGSQDQLIKTLVTDQLPADLQLVKEDSLDLGTVAMGQTKSATVTVKVTANTNTTIKNQACFTGDSVDHKVPQQGCDVAYVKVEVPAATPTPTPKPTPVATPTPTPGAGQVLGTTAPTTLPDTGAAGVLGTAVGLGSMATAAVAYIRSRKQGR
ncbi:MAG TPA: LPXTG cell wall anchor domain-containing protein [Candidatus Saccharimonadia bacterium]|nr:LPXTG cell wall anchor domain-containing protein [Candidatus Saccharimonadia bacterium]